MIKYFYESTGRRTLEQIKGLKIIDVGGAVSFAYGYLDAIVEIRVPQAIANHIFLGDMCDYDTWIPVLEYVKENGKFDYCICSHTLEDLNNPVFVAKQIEKIAKAGLIVVPSKYRELARFAGNFRGFPHHRHIIDVIDGVLTSFPKYNWIEDKIFDEVHKGLPDHEELIVEWEDEIGMVEVNNGMPYGTATMNGEEHVMELYKKLL